MSKLRMTTVCSSHLSILMRGGNTPLEAIQMAGRSGTLITNLISLHDGHHIFISTYCSLFPTCMSFVGCSHLFVITTIYDFCYALSPCSSDSFAAVYHYSTGTPHPLSQWKSLLYLSNVCQILFNCY